MTHRAHTSRQHTRAVAGHLTQSLPYPLYYPVLSSHYYSTSAACYCMLRHCYWGGPIPCITQYCHPTITVPLLRVTVCYAAAPNETIFLPTAVPQSAISYQPRSTTLQEWTHLVRQITCTILIRTLRKRKVPVKLTKRSVYLARWLGIVCK